VFFWVVTFQWVPVLFTEAKKAPVVRSLQREKDMYDVHNEVWRPLQSISRQLMRMGLLPYVFVCFIGNSAEILMKEFVEFWKPDWCTLMTPSLVSTIFPDVKKGLVLPPETFVAFQGHPGSIECEDAWRAAAIIFKVMNFVVCSTAVATLFLYQRNMHEVLKCIQPDGKFNILKILLLVNFLQSIVFDFVFEDPLKRERYYSLLVCWEAFFLAVYQQVAYKVNHFESTAQSDEKLAISAQTSIAPTAGLDDMMNRRTARQPLLAAEEEPASSCALM